jgi:hypothetical protein
MASSAFGFFQRPRPVYRTRAVDDDIPVSWTIKAEVVFRAWRELEYRLEP